MNGHIEYKGVSYAFKNEQGEDQKRFHDRCWFLVLYPDKRDLVEMYLNKKYYGVTYSAEIEKSLSTCLRTFEFPGQSC